MSQCPHVQTSSVTLRELSLAVLVHPWLRRHRLGVQKLIKTLAASPQLFETETEQGTMSMNKNWYRDRMTSWNCSVLIVVHQVLNKLVNLILDVLLNLIKYL